LVNKWPISIYKGKPGGWAWLIGTPKRHNWFWEEWQKAQTRPDWAAFHAPTLGVKIGESALTRTPHPLENPFIPFSEIDDLWQTMPDRSFRQEILAEFVDDGGGVFRNVRAQATARPAEPIEGRQYLGGLDWALSVDYTVLTILDAETRTVVMRDRFNGAEYSLQRERIAAAAKKYNDALIIGEANAMGKPNNDELRRMGCRVRDFTTTSTTKADIIESLAAAFERGQITILDEPVGIAELESYESKRLAGGGVQYNAPSGMHDDTVMSLALALSATQRTELRWGT
jgi:phage terminase large subunit-like protein